MSLPKVYLVVGHTGAYSDHTEWTVAAYTTREQAEAHCRLAKEAVAAGAEENWRGRNAGGPEGKYAVQARLKEQGNPYDPRMVMDYTGTGYVVEEVPLIRHVDEFLEHIDQFNG